ncbi:dirigent protein 1-like [Phalaenopsis equestris]|uniref:dirigent protein 1-like n=1 Tax=Phalaenopsis equestris TaxID=78828 RepID=UPI0009E24447|nr:dirigent protein 1-like [Phalaenopsis equestris]
MASITFPLTIFLAITLTLTLILKISAATPETNEKETRLHFYANERTESPNATVIKVVSSPVDQSKHFYSFGDILVYDNPITEGYDPTSRLLGRVQGTMTVASLDGSAALFTENWFFTDLHPWTGSSITVVGRHTFREETAEFQVVGGTGQFRNAEGYLLMTRSSTNDVNIKIVEVKVVVFNS